MADSNVLADNTLDCCLAYDRSSAILTDKIPLKIASK